MAGEVEGELPEMGEWGEDFAAPDLAALIYFLEMAQE
jgi:hypothetical protein